MKLAQVLTALDVLVPPHLAEPWDQVGLHVGDPDQSVRKVLLCIDLTESVLEEAIQERAQLVIAYHPPIFKPLARLTATDPKERIILKAARKGIAIYSPHTALDATVGGVNDWLAEGLGLGAVRTIQPSPEVGEQVYKVITFIPHKSLDTIRAAMSRAGAGIVGDYESCSFSGEGLGTFRGDDTTHPAVGKPGRFERVPELRLEMPVSASSLPRVLDALRETHPYEEPVFDIYPLKPVPCAWTGQGRVVKLDKPISLNTLIKRVKERLGIKTLEVATPPELGQIERIGLCVGAGGSLLKQAGPIDAFLTGEMRHHDILDATGRGIAVLLPGHTQTERPYLQVYRSQLRKLIRKGIDWQISKTDRPPSAPR